MSKLKKLAPHPRLFVSANDIARLKQPPRLKLLKDCHARLEQSTNQWVGVPPLEYPRNRHNELLLRAREVQTRVVSLCTRYRMTGRDTFKKAALKHIEMMRDWEYWSWITWRTGDSRPEAIYDLSYGENATTLALAFDWLYDSLADDEKQLFLDTAEKWVLPSARDHVRPGGPTWFGRPGSNWNTVCTGGLGMLCLSMREHIDDAEALLERVEQSIDPFFRGLDDSHGGWPEGIGYWNYGMRYGFMYLLSHSSATGGKHPHMDRPGLAATMSFPLELTPWGHAASFGDVNRWRPIPIHYRMARAVGRDDAAAQVHLRAEQSAESSDGPWPNDAEWLLLHPGEAVEAVEPQTDVFRFYKGLDWAVLADRLPEPAVYASVRGGTTEVSHAHLDLLSFHAVLDGQHVLQSLGPIEYLDSTFSPRRYDLPEMDATQKNTLLINGVGVARGSSLDVTEPIVVGGFPGLRMEATSAFGEQRGGQPVVDFAGRMIVRLGERGLLIVDRVETPHPARVECRVHTRSSVRASDDGFALESGGKTAQLAYVADVPATMRAGGTCPTTPSDQPAMVLRYITDPLCTQATLVTLLTRGKELPRLSLQRTDGTIQIKVQLEDFDADLKMDHRLNVAALA